MRVITAICFILSATELALLQKNPSAVRKFIVLQAPGLLVGLVGLMTIVVYAITMITGQEPSLGSAPFLNLFLAPETRAALLTAILFLISGCALVLLAIGSRGTAHIAHALMLPGAMLSYMVPVSYLLGVQSIHEWLNVPVALNTGLAFCALSIAIFCARTDTWLMSVFTGDHAGSVMARQLLPALLMIPLLIGWLRLYGERAGYFESAVGVVLVAITYAACFLFLLWLSARSVNRTDDKRQTAVEELRKSEGKYRTIVETANEGIWITDAERKTILINQRMADMLGYTIEEMLGRVPSEFLDEDQEQLALRIREELKTVQSIHEEFKFHRKDGSVLWVISNATSLYDAGGQFNGTLSMLTDITKRKQAEEGLNRYREHLEELVMQRTQELEDKNLQLHKEMIERVHAEEEKNKLEVQLIQAQRMEALGKLAGGIAHDLNNMLQPILINSEMISDKLPTRDQEREYLDQIIDVAQFGKNLIKQIKMFGSSQKPILKAIPIGPVVHKALVIVTRTLSSDIKLNQHVPMNEHMVNADPIQINQLVLNLCSNAVQSMTPQGGTLDVSLDETVVTQSTPAIGNDLNPGKYMILTVSDTGSGIDQEIMKNIFDPFFTTRKSDKGTGLGLAVVYEVVKNSQGSILLYSEVGKGTRFEIFFPLHLDSLN